MRDAQREKTVAQFLNAYDQAENPTGWKQGFNETADAYLARLQAKVSPKVYEFFGGAEGVYRVTIFPKGDPFGGELEGETWTRQELAQSLRDFRAGGYPYKILERV